MQGPELGPFYIVCYALRGGPSEEFVLGLVKGVRGPAQDNKFLQLNHLLLLLISL